MGQIFNGLSPANDGSEIETTETAPEGVPIEDLPLLPN
jgi:hypothetical protein